MAQASILNRALSVYALPPELLDSLAVRSIQAQAVDKEKAVAEADQQPEPTQLAAATGLGCQACPGAVFDTPDDQRAHFKSDWHRYNAKAKLQGKAVTSDEWDKMADGVSSISGSASSSSGSSQGSRITRLLSKARIEDTASDEEAELADLRRRAQLRTAVIWFTAKNPPASLGIPPDTQFGVHRALLSDSDTAADYLADLRRIQLGRPVPEDEERRLALFMVAGGHFAGMIISLRPRGPKDKQAVKGAGDVHVLQHKTFHRYTTRRKQGGSQALNDNSKSKAVSAGAMLRRYGEQELQNDIRTLMTEWEEDIALCERIFIRASTHGKHSFWGYDGAVLDKGDSRIKSFPFPTRRPTQQELIRCWHELCRVKVSHLSEDALAAQDEAYIASLQPKKQATAKPVVAAAPPKSTTPKLSAEEQARQDRRKRLVDMVEKGRLDALKSFVSRYTDEVEAGLLGIAAAAGQEEVVRYLLVEAKLDPATAIDTTKRPYDLSSTKGVRNTFRRVAFDHPTMWDWGAAHVPSGLSEEAEATQGAKKAERRRGLRDKMREKQASRADAEDEDAEPVPRESDRPAEVSGPGPRKLGGRSGGGGGGAGLAGLSAEMRLEIERERRARAAEARFGGVGR